MKRIYRVAEKPLKQSAKWLVLATGALLSACTQSDWRTASREPAGIAPDPQNNRQAVIEFYAADAFS